MKQRQQTSELIKTYNFLGKNQSMTEAPPKEPIVAQNQDEGI